MACSLFGICLSLFLEQRADIGRIVALDEAHKYMGDSAESEALTKSLLSTIRVQRHVGARVIISTQEPTISPKLLDLCSVTIVHRFTSPDWMATLKQHLAGASKRTGDSGRDKSDEEDCEEESGVVPLRLDPSTLVEDLFSEIVSLRPGQALIFSPSAVVGLKDSEPAEQHAIENTSFGVFTNGNSEDGSSRNASSTNGERGSQAKIVRLGNGVLKVRVRKRITQDGGRSIMAS